MNLVTVNLSRTWNYVLLLHFFLLNLMMTLIWTSNNKRLSVPLSRCELNLMNFELINGKLDSNDYNVLSLRPLAQSSRPPPGTPRHWLRRTEPVPDDPHAHMYKSSTWSDRGELSLRTGWPHAHRLITPYFTPFRASYTPIWSSHAPTRLTYRLHAATHLKKT